MFLHVYCVNNPFLVTVEFFAKMFGLDVSPQIGLACSGKVTLVTLDTGALVYNLECYNEDQCFGACVAGSGLFCRSRRRNLRKVGAGARIYEIPES